MRDTTTMPAADWSDPKTLYRAKAQLKRAEPLVLNIPGDADLILDGEAAGCHCDEDSGVLWNCRPDVALPQLGRHAGLEGLENRVEAAETGVVTPGCGPPAKADRLSRLTSLAGPAAADSLLRAPAIDPVPPWAIGGLQRLAPMSGGPRPIASTPRASLPPCGSRSPPGWHGGGVRHPDRPHRAFWAV